MAKVISKLQVTGCLSNCPGSTHLWAYADYFGLEEIVSEDFQHDRRYGAVKARNPFLTE